MKFSLLGVMHTTESGYSNFMIEYLGQTDTLLGKSLIVFKGPRLVRIMQNRGWKSRVTSLYNITCGVIGNAEPELPGAIACHCGV